MNYAEALKSLRHAYKMTQAEFAELLQVSKPTIQKLEAGDYPPSEKMAARLAELFRSERFRVELRPRVESGELSSVSAAFGGLLELVDAEEAASSGASASARPNGLADVLKRDHTEFLAMMRSQQDAIQKLSTSTKNFSESSRNIAESNKNLSESTKGFAESTKNFSESGKTIAEANRNLSESTKNFSESGKTLAESNKNLSESTKSLAKSNQNLSESNKSLAAHLSKSVVHKRF